MRAATACLMMLTTWARPLIGTEPPQRDVTTAVRDGLRILKTATDNYPKHRDCFACHHQTLPLFAAVETQREGVIDTLDAWQPALDFTAKSFDRQRERLAEGQNIGGRSATVSYGLWTYRLGQRPADATTSAMVEYLLRQQRDDGSWKPPSIRPPLEKSLVSCTVLSAAGLKWFGTADQQRRIETALARAITWLRLAPLEEHEDVVFALWGESLLAQPTVERLAALSQALQDQQRDDGGWAQLATTSSDAYATGQAVWVLRESPVPFSAAVIERGIQWLQEHQEADGSWHVVTRSKPIQEWFDNGDPHGDDQFISIAATGWATAALARHQHRRPLP